jgi:hypothetical protein
MRIMKFEWLSPEEEENWPQMGGICAECKSDVCQYCGKPESRIAKPPKVIDIEIWVWKTCCYACKKPTRVAWPAKDVGNNLAESIDLNSLENLPAIIADKLPFIQKTNKKMQNIEEYGNVCENCSAYQGDWFVLEDCLQLGYFPEEIEERFVVSVPLTEEERIIYAYPRNYAKLRHPRKGNYSALCEECYALYKKKEI